MTTNPHDDLATNPLREMFAPKSLDWMIRKDTWFFLVSLVLGVGFCVVFGCLLFLINRPL